MFYMCTCVWTIIELIDYLYHIQEPPGTSKNTRLDKARHETFTLGPSWPVAYPHAYPRMGFTLDCPWSLPGRAPARFQLPCAHCLVSRIAGPAEKQCTLWQLAFRV